MEGSKVYAWGISLYFICQDIFDYMINSTSFNNVCHFKQERTTHKARNQIKASFQIFKSIKACQESTMSLTHWLSYKSSKISLFFNYIYLPISTIPHPQLKMCSVPNAKRRIRREEKGNLWSNHSKCLRFKKARTHKKVSMELKFT